jgi:hypothetical protein
LKTYFLTKNIFWDNICLLLASLYVVFDLKHGKARQDQARQDGKVPTLLGQEMADLGKTGSAISFNSQLTRETLG